MAANRDQERALELIEKAMEHQMAAEFEEAIRLYKESIALYPTADAHTYLGWAYSFQAGSTKPSPSARSPSSSTPSLAIPTTTSACI